METLTKEFMSNVREGAKLYTDDFTSYKRLKRVYDHKFVKHSRSQYVKGRVHTNIIESFWALLNHGIFHFQKAFAAVRG